MSEALAGSTTDDRWDHSEECADLEALMSEDSVGDNYGSAAGRMQYTTRNDSDGEMAPPASRSLNTASRGARQYAGQGGVSVVHRTELSWHGARGYEPGERQRTLTEEQWRGLDAGQVQAAALDTLGFTLEEFQRITAPGAKSAATREVEQRFDARLLEISDANDGRGTSLLGRALGLYFTPATGDCPGIRRRISRARQARDGTAPVPRPPRPVTDVREPGALCMCGCGHQTPLATKTQRGNVRGHPTRFLPGHHS